MFFLFSDASLKIKLSAVVTPWHMHASFCRVARKHGSYPAGAVWARAERLSCHGGAVARSHRWSAALLSPPRWGSTPWWSPASWFFLRAFQQFHWKNISPNSNAIIQTRREKESPCSALRRESKPHSKCVSDWNPDAVWAVLYHSQKQQIL